MKALSSIIAISLSIAAASSYAKDPLPVETLGRAGPAAAASGVGTRVDTPARRHLNVAQVMGRGAPVVTHGSGSSAPRTSLSDAAVAKRFGRA